MAAATFRDGGMACDSSLQPARHWAPLPLPRARQPLLPIPGASVAVSDGGGYFQCPKPWRQQRTEESIPRPTPPFHDPSTQQLFQLKDFEHPPLNSKTLTELSLNLRPSSHDICVPHTREDSDFDTLIDCVFPTLNANMSNKDHITSQAILSMHNDWVGIIN